MGKVIGEVFLLQGGGRNFGQVDLSSMQIDQIYLKSEVYKNLDWI